MDWLISVGHDVISQIIGAPILFLLGLVLRPVLESARRFIKNISIPPNALLWKVDHKELLAREEIWNLEKPLKATLEKKTLNNLAFSSVRLWRSSKIPVDQYPIVIRFASGTNILQWDWRMVPDKDACPVIEDKKSEKMAERAYLISLEPKYVLTLKFHATGDHNVKPPTVLAREALLTDKNKAIILLSEDAIQVSLVTLLERFKIISTRLADAVQVSLVTLRERLRIILTKLPSDGKLGVSVLILTIALGTVLTRTDWLNGSGVSRELVYFVVGLTLTSSIGFIVFRLRVWGSDMQVFFQTLALQFPGVSTSRVRRIALQNALISFVKIMGVAIVVCVTVLEWFGRHDLILQILQWSIEKLVRLINVLGH